MTTRPERAPFSPFDPRTVDLDAFSKAVDDGWVFGAQWTGRRQLDEMTQDFVDYAMTQDRPANPNVPYPSKTTYPIKNDNDVMDLARHILANRFHDKNKEAMAFLAELIPLPTAGWRKSTKAGVSLGVVYGVSAEGVAQCEEWPSVGGLAVLLISEDNTKAIIFNMYTFMPSGSFDLSEGKEVHFSGHTCYKAHNGWYNFSPRGIEDSFYGGDATDISALLEKQLAKVDKSLERLSGVIPVPGTKWQIHKDAVEKAKAAIQGGGTHSFRPHGFGVGNTFSKRRAHSYAKLANAETAAFFGVDVLYYTEDDCD